jgi:succinoglycan biosynthesis protein ExoM
MRSLSRQKGLRGVRLRVIVADNAATPTMKALIEATARESDLEAVYVHAPAHNISIARNACLDTANAEWIAFLDDDEIASPGWLSALIDEAIRGRWDAVLGPVQAVYGSSAPRWVRDGDFHSTRPVFVRGRIETGYTGNVLINRRAVEGQRFRTELGRSGGEDDDFFSRLREAGGRIGFAPDALAHEAIPPERLNLRWLMKRSFRNGQSYGARVRSRSNGVFKKAGASAFAAAKAGVCLLAACAHFPVATRRNRFLSRAALHCGVVARLAGLSELSLY